MRPPSGRRGDQGVGDANRLLGSRLGNAVAEVLLDTDRYQQRSAAMLAFATDNTWDVKASKVSNWYAEL